MFKENFQISNFKAERAEIEASASASKPTTKANFKELETILLNTNSVNNLFMFTAAMTKLHF